MQLRLLEFPHQITHRGGPSFNNSHARRRPIIAPWLRDRQEGKAIVRWSVGHAGHVTGYHAARLPLYAATLAARSPRGLWRVVAGTWRWTCDAEAMPLRTHAVDGKDADTYLRLLRERETASAGVASPPSAD